MKTLVKTLSLLTILSASGFSQSFTVDNNQVNFYMGNGSTLLNANTEYYLGSFGSLDSAQINGLFGADSASNYNALFSNFSVIGSVRNPDAGGFGFGFMPIADPDSGYLGYNGNKAPGLLNGRPMQVVVLGSVNGLNSPGNLLQIGIYEAYNFTAATAVNFETADPFDVNNFTFSTVAQGSTGANAIVGSGGPAGQTTFSLSTLTVPEPSSASLMLLGAAGLMVLRRLKKSV
jgi:hypothetical protein